MADWTKSYDRLPLQCGLLEGSVASGPATTLEQPTVAHQPHMAGSSATTSPVPAMTAPSMPGTSALPSMTVPAMPKAPALPPVLEASPEPPVRYGAMSCVHTGYVEGQVWNAIIFARWGPRRGEEIWYYQYANDEDAENWVPVPDDWWGP